MNDEELPINAELASAYLDNELDPAERASVSADPHVMSMVDSFSRVRAILGDIGIPRPRAPEGEAARGGAERYGQTNDAPVLADR